jgi:hypothetical protein
VDPAVVLVGGGSSVATSTLAAALCDRFGASRLSVGRGELEDGDRVWDLPLRELLRRLVASGRAVEDHLVGVVGDQLAAGRRCVVDGEAVQPSLLVRLADARVAAGYVVEDDPSRLASGLEHGSSEFRLLSPARRAHAVQAQLRYGAWLAREAVRCGQPVVAARPQSSLADRFVDALDDGRGQLTSTRASGAIFTPGPMVDDALTPLR